MEHWYNNQKLLNNKKLLNFVFSFIKNLTKVIFNRKFYKINSIKQQNKEWIIYYFYPGDRVTYFKSATKIITDCEIIKLFTPLDALLIGFCASQPSKEDLENNIDFLK